MEALKVEPISIEVSTGNFLIRGGLEARGDLLVFLNDQNRSSFPVVDAQVMADGPEYKVSSMKQSSFTVAQEHIAFVALLNEEDAAKVQYVQASRPVVFYTNWFAIRGNLHVSSEARDDELMDPTREFFAVTNVSVYPIRKMTYQPQHNYPMAAIQRSGIVGYHVYEQE